MAIANQISAMKNFWENKVCIITGSSIGIGRQLANDILSQRGKVMLNARDEDRLQQVYQKLSIDGNDVSFFAGDVSDEVICRQLVDITIDHFGRLDVLINNAAITADGLVEELSPTLFQKILNVNVVGSIQMTHFAIPFLKQSQGSVLFVGSIAGIHGLPGQSAYCTSKMALTAFAESLQAELSSFNVHVGLAYLGFTENDPQKSIYDLSGQIVPQPKRNIGRPAPVQKVALQLMEMIRKRKFKVVFSSLGKTLNWLNRLLPGMFQFILDFYFKRKRMDAQI